MNKQYECEILSSESTSFFKNICLPHTYLLHNSFPHHKKSFEYYCPLNNSPLQINANYLLFPEFPHSALMGFLQEKLSIQRLSPLTFFSFIELKNSHLDFQKEKEISSFVFNRKSYGFIKKLEFSVWQKEFLYVLYSNYFVFFDKNWDLFFINLENNKKNTVKLNEFQIKTLNFCEFHGDFQGNAFLFVYHENLKKYGLLELEFNEDKPRILQNILFPNNVINSMNLNFFTKNFELSIFSHEFLFPNDKTIKNKKNLLFFIIQKFEFCFIFRILVYEEKNHSFINYFNFETNFSLKTLDFKIFSINDQLFCEFDEKFIFFLRNCSSFEKINEKSIVEKLFIEENLEENMHFIKEFFSLKLVKTLIFYENFEDLTFQTKEIIGKILKKPINDHLLKYFLKYLIDFSPKKILYILKYFSFLNKKEESFENNCLKLWRNLGFYTHNRFFEKKRSKKFSEHFGEFNLVLEDFDDYEFIWLYLALKTGNNDFVRDIVMFNGKFKGGDIAKTLQKLLILSNSEEKKK